MFDHIGIVVENLSASRGLYQHILGAIGIKLLQDNSNGEDGWLVFGEGEGKPFFVISAGRPSFWGSKHEPSSSPVHCAFSAPSIDSVDEFYSIGLRFGATDNGAPGDRGRGYYASYIIDHDGNNIEAGFRSPH